jgi:hypothetical protein
LKKPVCGSDAEMNHIFPHSAAEAARNNVAQGASPGTLSYHPPPRPRRRPTQRECGATAESVSPAFAGSASSCDSISQGYPGHPFVARASCPPLRDRLGRRQAKTPAWQAKRLRYGGRDVRATRGLKSTPLGLAPWDIVIPTTPRPRRRPAQRERGATAESLSPAFAGSASSCDSISQGWRPGHPRAGALGYIFRAACAAL